jgi:hypothetical protein
LEIHNQVRKSVVIWFVYAQRLLKS